MKEIYFKGLKIFEFNDDNAIQIIGTNNYLIRIITDIYHKVFSGYKFSDEDIEAMNGYYPEVKENGKVLRKNDIIVIKLSSLEDVLEQLTVKKDSILLKYISSLNNDMLLNKVIEKIDRLLVEFSICIDNLIEKRLSTKNIFIKTDINDISLEKILKNFIDIYFVNLEQEILPLWLLKDCQLVDLFVNMIELLLAEGNVTKVIIDKLDSKMEIEEYRKFVQSLFNLTEIYPNFGLWIIPSTKEGVLLDYRIFDNTYVINDDIIKFEDFEVTYESICRNYPDNNLPQEYEVLKTLLKIFPFHAQQKEYLATKETVILLVFLKLLGEEKSLNIRRSKLTKLEYDYLNSFR